MNGGWRAGRSEVPTVCILAGGRGSRLGELTTKVPKPLLNVAGRPFLDHQLNLLASYGVCRAVLCVGFLGDLIERDIGTECHGIELAYSYDSSGLDGTLGAIRRALPLLGERFLILYGDTYLRIDYWAVAATWLASDCPGVMTVLRNDGRWDGSNAILRGNLVERYDKRNPTPDMRWIDYGLGGLYGETLGEVPDCERDLGTLYSLLAERGKLLGIEAHERFYEIGTPSALAETETFLRQSATRETR